MIIIQNNKNKTIPINIFMMLKIERCKNVYEPSDDTFLLEHVVKNKIPQIISERKKLTIIDVGCGTGYITLLLCDIVMKMKHDIDNKSINIIAIDIDTEPVKCTKRNLINNCKSEYRKNIDIIQCNSASCLRKEAVDIAIVNPPYLPESNTGYSSIDHSRMWSGGPTGIEVPVEIINLILDPLKSNGTIYMVLSSLSNIKKLISEFNGILDMRIIARKKLFFEELYVYEMKKYQLVTRHIMSDTF
jgi:release factor glutamine methyltransferase